MRLTKGDILMQEQKLKCFGCRKTYVSYIPSTAEWPLFLKCDQCNNLFIIDADVALGPVKESFESYKIKVEAAYNPCPACKGLLRVHNFHRQCPKCGLQDELNIELLSKKFIEVKRQVYWLHLRD